MSLEKYRPRPSVRDGVWISLDDAPEVRFLVREPSEMNLTYHYTLLDIVEIDPATNRPKGMGAMLRGQREAFIQTCILDVEGLDLSQFANGAGKTFKAALPKIVEEYPEAITELFRKANELAAQNDTAVEETLGNSASVSPGT